MVRPASIAKSAPRDRALTQEGIGLTNQYLDRVVTSPSIRATLELLMLTMVRKSELINAEWSEANSGGALRTVLTEGMKRRDPHLIFLSRQALDLLVAQKTFADSSDSVLPSRYDPGTPMSSATLDQVIKPTYQLAQKDGKSQGKYRLQDLRRRASTLLR